MESFLRRALDEVPTDEDRKASLQILSNPFDLTFAAELIAQAATPTARGIVDEAFRLADEGPGNHAYRSIHGMPFPLVPFGKLAVEMRLKDRNWFDSGEFETERQSLTERKLLVVRSIMTGDGKTEQRTLFRHERVWDFFIVAAFKADPDLLDRHVDDPRFRGAYLRIAETWPTDDARRVRDLLVERAALRSDNTVSNEFVRRQLARRPTGVLETA